MLYLMRPGSDLVGEPEIERSIAARIRALAIHHESHGKALSFDDATPDFTDFTPRKEAP